MYRRSFLYGAMAMTTLFCVGVGLSTARAWPITQEQFVGAQCSKPLDCNVSCLTLVQSVPQECGGAESCWVFVGNPTINTFMACTTYDSTSANTCTVDPTLPAKYPCKGTSWYCSCASVSGGVVVCNVTGCPCGGFGGFPVNPSFSGACT